MSIKSWVEYGNDEADKCLGIRVAKPHQIATQWFGKAAEVDRLALDITAGRRLGGSIYARSALAKGAFASKVMHTFTVQAPFEPARLEVLKRLQTTLNKLVFGSFYNVAVETAMQPSCDAGVGHINITRRLEAGWAHLVTHVMSSELAVWKNIWWFNLRQVYGELCDLDLPLTTMTYKLLSLRTEPSQVQQLAMASWAKLRLAPADHVAPELSGSGQKRHTLAQWAGDTINTQKVWVSALRDTISGAHVADQRLWFNTCLLFQGHETSRMVAPSTYDSEKEAIQWAQSGLIRFKSVLNGTRVIGNSAFRRAHPALDSTLIHEARTNLPVAWQQALQDGTHLQTHPPEECLPRGLLDDSQPHKQQHFAVVFQPTLVDRPIKPVVHLRASHNLL